MLEQYVGGRSVCIEGFSWEGLEHSLVQILVVVAIIQTNY